MTATTYALPHEMHEFAREDRFLFFDPVNFVWFQTDRLGKGIIDGLARSGVAEDAALEVSRLAEAPIERARSYVAQALDQLLQIGFVHEGEYVPEPLSGGIAAHPFILYLHMTPRCNLRCPYCYNQENRHELWRTPVGTYEQYARVLDEAADLGFKEVKITGGEPLLNKDSLALARHAKRRGLWVNLLTNGTLVDEDVAREIVEAVHTVSLSLDSPHPEEHDAVRGKNTWRKVLRAIGLLRNAGLEYLHLNAVVNPINKDSVGEFLEFAWDELEAEKVTLAPTGIDVADPRERWKSKEYMISADDVWEIYETQRAFQHRKARESPPVIDRRSLWRSQCGAGNGVVSMDSNGDLYPCQTMHTPELRCGNVFENSLGQILEESGLLRQVREMTVEQLEDCPTCPMRYVCSGGCRMEAYSREGKLEARNRDMCPIFFTRALDKLWVAASVPVSQHADVLAERNRTTPLDFFESYA